MAEYIDKEALNERLSVLSRRMGQNFNTFTVLSELNNFPAADVRENVKARWIDMGDHLLCSGCGATHYGTDKNFCPNCGAQMGLGEEDV